MNPSPNRSKLLGGNCKPIPSQTHSVYQCQFILCSYSRANLNHILYKCAKGLLPEGLQLKPKSVGDCIAQLGSDTQLRTVSWALEVAWKQGPLPLDAIIRAHARYFKMTLHALCLYDNKVLPALGHYVGAREQNKYSSSSIQHKDVQLYMGCTEHHGSHD